jgi:nucleotide-binding universal stress UspA family protein
MTSAQVIGGALDPGAASITSRKVAVAIFHTIVVAVDFSDISKHVVETARELARLHHARLHVVHAIGDPFSSMYAVETTGLDLPDVLRQWTDAAQQRLANLVAKHPLEPDQLTTAVLPGAPAHAIVKYAADHQADLIVVGSHGRGTVSRLLLGSVAERVLHHAGRSVLVVSNQARVTLPIEVDVAATATA